ncbi:hypothetical protein HRbin12_01100 [bacterium HR12]|nr:hypothetical protein HRbin12_01100 [bacterium HR12]
MNIGEEQEETIIVEPLEAPTLEPEPGNVPVGAPESSLTRGSRP